MCVCMSPSIICPYLQIDINVHVDIQTYIDVYIGIQYIIDIQIGIDIDTHTHTYNSGKTVNRKKIIQLLLELSSKSFSKSTSHFHILFLPSFINYLHQPYSSLPEIVFLIDGIWSPPHKSILKAVSGKMTFSFSSSLNI